MSATPITRAETQLRALGERRRKLEGELAKVDKELGAAIPRARAVRLTMPEIARLAGTSKQTLYRCVERTEGGK